MPRMLPCPFCGGTNLGVCLHGLYVICFDCDCHGAWSEGADEGRAVAAWNRRVEATEVKA